MDSEKKLTAPYLPFQSFETALNHLAALGTIPPKIDHTVFPNMGGMIRGQVLSAFKFLGLTDYDGTPSPQLKELALNKETRKATLRKIINDKYPNITESDLAAMSSGQLDTKLNDKGYNATGATKQKVRAFLLKAAEYSEIPLSRLLTSKGPRGPRKKRPAANANSKRNDVEKSPITESGSSGNGGGSGNSSAVGSASTLPPDTESIQMPIPLAPGRLAYIQLPKDWKPKEVKKLISILNLSLGVDDSEDDKE
jgi:hypothetical protein